MSNELITILIAAGAVMLGTFFLRSVFGIIFRLGGLAAIAYFARRPDGEDSMFAWLTADDAAIIAASAAFGFIVAMILNGFVWRASKLGRHVFTPFIAIALCYGAAYTINLS
ncbi:MAG: hypothetical protein AAF225_01555 [Pseudomonadota bacterium]